MEEKILPALEAVPGLSALLLKMNLQGYDYRRDDEFMMWGSADLLWKLPTRCEDDMATPNPLEPVKGAGTTLWVYNGKGDAYANPLSDDDWQRLAKVKDLTPGEMTAETLR